MIRAIIFDCFGVLYRSSADELYDRCEPSKRDELHDVRLQRDRGHIHYDEYLEKVGNLIGAPMAEVQQVTESAHVRNEELFKYLRTLDHNTVKTGMLSNIGDTIISQLFSAEEIEQLFDSTVLSYQVGMVKPDPAIFRLMADKLGLSPEECVMIDDLEKNCSGAEYVGMKSIQHVSNEHTLSRLAELLHA